MRFETNIYGRQNIKPNVSWEYCCFCRNGLQRVLRGKGGERRTFRRWQDETTRNRQHRMGCIRRWRKTGRRPHEIRSGNWRRLVEPGTTEVISVCSSKRMIKYFSLLSVLPVSEMCASRVLDSRKWSVACTWARSYGWPLWTWPTRTNSSREDYPNKWRPRERSEHHSYQTLKGEY